jgi:transposase InsO family protein
VRCCRERSRRSCAEHCRQLHRECLALETDTSFASQRVTRVLDDIIAQRGAPKALRLDNGPELTSRHFLAWCIERKIAMNHIQPGKPMQNGHIESFNGRFRDECLNANWFQNLFDARQKISIWRDDYNRARPHSSLDYRTPDEFAAHWQSPSSLPTWMPQPEPSVKATLTAHLRARSQQEHLRGNFNRLTGPTKRVRSEETGHPATDDWKLGE